MKDLDPTTEAVEGRRRLSWRVRGAIGAIVLAGTAVGGHLFIQELQETREELGRIEPTEFVNNIIESAKSTTTEP